MCYCGLEGLVTIYYKYIINYVRPKSGFWPKNGSYPKKSPKMNLTRTCFEMRTSKGLASHCKAKTTFTFYFFIINASESILQC